MPLAAGRMAKFLKAMQIKGRLSKVIVSFDKVDSMAFPMRLYGEHAKSSNLLLDDRNNNFVQE